MHVLFIMAVAAGWSAGWSRTGLGWAGQKEGFAMALLGDHVRIKVYGVMHGQYVNNDFCYYVMADETAADLLTAFRAVWRASALAFLGDEYSVVRYWIGVFDGLVWKSTNKSLPNVTVWPDVRPLPRYKETAVLTGSSTLDKGSITTAQMPSFVCFGFAKTTFQVTKIDASTVLPQEKVIHGAFGISGVPQAAIDDGESNTINAGYMTSCTGLATDLRVIDDTSGHIMTMEVWSLYKDRKPRYDAGAPLLARAGVTSIAVEPYATSRVSRKQSASNLG